MFPLAINYLLKKYKVQNKLELKSLSYPLRANIKINYYFVEFIFVVEKKKPGL